MRPMRACCGVHFMRTAGQTTGELAGSTVASQVTPAIASGSSRQRLASLEVALASDLSGLQGNEPRDGRSTPAATRGLANLRLVDGAFK